MKFFSSIVAVLTLITASLVIQPVQGQTFEEKSIISAFSGDGKLVATCNSYGELIKLWDVATGKKIKDINVDNSIYAMSLNMDGTKIHYRSATNKYSHVLDVATGDDLKVASSGLRWDVNLFAPMEMIPMVFNIGGKLQLYDYNKRTMYWEYEAKMKKYGEINCARYLPKINVFYYTTGGVLYRIDANSNDSKAEKIMKVEKEIDPRAISPSGKYAIIDKKMYDLETGEAMWGNDFSASPYEFFFSEDEEQLFIVTPKGVIACMVANGKATGLIYSEFTGYPNAEYCGFNLAHSLVAYEKSAGLVVIEDFMEGTELFELNDWQGEWRHSKTAAVISITNKVF